MKYVVATLALVALAFGASHLVALSNKPVAVGGVAESGPTYFSEVDKTGVVMRTIVATQAVIDSGVEGNPSNWVQTTTDGSLRKNYASKGYVYDKANDVFIPPKPAGNVTLDAATVRWVKNGPAPAVTATFVSSTSTPI